jgi:hypothetical protein
MPDGKGKDAGEDDLDAPDLCVKAPSPLPSEVDCSAKPGHGQNRMALRPPGNARAHGGMSGRPPVSLDADQSAVLREKLLTEPADITSADLATKWARGALTAKNSLTAIDAKLVENAFERTLLEFPSSNAGAPLNNGSSVTQIDRPPQVVTTERTALDQAKGTDKSVLTLGTPRRYRNREHLHYVAQQACLVCGRKPSDPHHLGFTQPRALGRKVSDEFAVPLCRGHHRAVHRSPNERVWWRHAGIDPIKVARRLWKQTRGVEQQSPERPALPGRTRLQDLPG